MLRGELLQQLLCNWSEEVSVKVFANNFFKDFNYEEVQKNFTAIAAAMAKDEAFVVRRDSAFGGIVENATGPVLYYSLAPVEDHRVQYVEFLQEV